MNDNSWLLILGANSDIGVSIAYRYAKEGYNIYFASRNIKHLNKIARDVELRFSVATKVIYFDACEFEKHASFYQSLKVKPHGVLVTFGIMHNQQKAQKKFSFSKEMIDVNFSGAVSILEIIASDFEKRSRGFIVGISSVAGDRGRMSNYIYGATKSAFTSYLQGLRHRLIKFNVNVLTVKPGFVETKMTKDINLPKKLTAKPDEVSNIIFKAVTNRKSTIYIKPIWRIIMSVIIHLPDLIFNRTKL